MRYMFMAWILAFALCAAPVFAEEESQETAESGVEADEAEEASSDEPEDIYTGEEDERAPETEYGASRPDLMPPGESYDENTGLPNVTGSDTDGEIE